MALFCPLSKKKKKTNLGGVIFLGVISTELVRGTFTKIVPMTYEKSSTHLNPSVQTDRHITYTYLVCMVEQDSYSPGRYYQIECWRRC